MQAMLCKEKVFETGSDYTYLPVKTLGTHYQSRWAGIALLVQRLALQRIPAVPQNKISRGSSERKPFNKT